MAETVTDYNGPASTDTVMFRVPAGWTYLGFRVTPRGQVKPHYRGVPRNMQVLPQAENRAKSNTFYGQPPEYRADKR